MAKELYPIEQMIGRKFGRLTVIKEGKPIVKRYLNFLTFRESVSRTLVCKCDCGKTITIRKQYLMSGTKSCGCATNEARMKNVVRFREVLFANMTEAEIERRRELARKLGKKSRKYEEVCTYCGKKEHYAKGLCKNCYTRVWHSGELDRRGSNAAKKAIIDAEYKAKMAAKRQARIDSCNPTTERGEKFLEMYKAGKTLQEIADIHGITKERVRQVMKGV